MSAFHISQFCEAVLQDLEPKPESNRMSIAVLENEGARAVFKGKRFVLIPNYDFWISSVFRSLERKITLSFSSGEVTDLDGIAAFDSDSNRIRMMGTREQAADILVIFATLDEGERADWGVTAEQAKRWPCRLDYESDEQTGVLRRWRLVLDIPWPVIGRIAEIATLTGIDKLKLEVHLSGLYMPEREVSKDGGARTNLAYLLPKSHWGGKSPKVYGYATCLQVDQRLFRQRTFFGI